MSDVKPFTIISGGANEVDLEAERFARDFGSPVQIFIHDILHDLCNRVSVVQRLVSLPVTQKIWVQFPAKTLF